MVLSDLLVDIFLMATKVRKHVESFVADLARFVVLVRCLIMKGKFLATVVTFWT